MQTVPLLADSPNSRFEYHRRRRGSPALQSQSGSASRFNDIHSRHLQESLMSSASAAQSHASAPPAAPDRPAWQSLTASAHSDSSSNSDHAAAAPGSNDEDDAKEEGEAEEDGQDTQSSDSEGEGTTSRRQRQRIHFDVEQLQTVYHLPLKTAAERLGVCEAALKRICRRNRIHKWPYRQLSSVRRRIADLKDRRAAHSASQVELGSLGRSVVAGVKDPLESVTPAQYDTQLQLLEEEQTRIIRSAHEARRPKKSSRPSATKLRLQQPRVRRLVPGEMLTTHLHSFRGNTDAGLVPMDLTQVDRDFPLLFLANVCESVRAYHCH